MAAIVVRRGQNANLHTDADVGKSRPPRRLVVSVVAAARQLWPRKLSANLAAITEVEQRTAERWLAGSQEISAESIARLIRSEHGLVFLTEIMADARPRWWSRFQQTSKVATIRREQLRIKEALHEAEQLVATLARAETAMAVSDEEFYRDQIDAFGAARVGLAGSVAR